MAPKRSWSSTLGWLARRPIPRAARPRFFASYARVFGIDLEEVERPLDEYETVDAFFTRRLRPGARPITSGRDVAVSPVDGVVMACGTAAGDRLLQVKGCEYPLGALLGDPEEAARFTDGTFVTLYLSPRDYHRIHAPVGGVVSAARHIAGQLFPVNARTVGDVKGLYTLNERLITYLDGDCGRVAVVKVAACGVGHVTATFDEGLHTHVRQCGGRRDYAPPRSVGKGEELGVFHLGSTVVVLFEPRMATLVPLGAGDLLRCGAPLARLGRLARA